MKRWERPLLLFSLALNAGFVSFAAVHRVPRPEPLPPPMLESPPDLPAVREWRAHRRAVLKRVLDLDGEQQQQLDTGFERLRPQLRDARMSVASERLAYKQALIRGDAAGVRVAAGTLSRAQARVDSLCAEAMLEETSSLRPEQRAHYVRWTFRHGPGSDLGSRHDGRPRPGRRPRFGPPPEGPVSAPDS